MHFRTLLSIAVFCCTTLLVAQKERNIWYFGNKAGLDFNTNPPTVLNNSQMNTVEGSASIADAQGNLLFYTNGETIWNKNHQVMANGSGLMGSISSSQGALIIKWPGNTSKYFVFTLAPTYAPDGFRYNVVDMTLASGLGSVTAKNVPLYTPCTERMAATKHCNGEDVWVAIHDTTTQFIAFLVTSNGIANAPVVTSVGQYYGSIGYQGSLKFSLDGKKAAVACVGIDSVGPWKTGLFELLDFDKSSGIFSNPVVLSKGYPGTVYAYGLEFSPGGSKLYGTRFNTSAQNSIYQWDLCAGSPAQMIASKVVIANPVNAPATIQRAPDGKIYITAFNQNSLSVIAFPDLPGTQCGYSASAISLGAAQSLGGLPAFEWSYDQVAALTHTSNCLDLNFSILIPAESCTSSPPANYSYSWNFGDPGSGLNNSSQLSNPSHNFSNSGKFTVKVVLSGECRNDTLTETLNVSNCLSVSEIDRVLPKLEIVPNPGAEQIEVESKTPLSVEIIDQQGKSFFKEYRAAGRHIISTQALPAGVYSVKMCGYSGTLIKKMIKIDNP